MKPKTRNPWLAATLTVTLAVGGAAAGAQTWVPASGGAVPGGAVDAGTSNGVPFTVCRASQGSALLPGKLRADGQWQGCKVTYQGSPVWAASYEVLTDFDGSWEPATQTVPENALEAGIGGGGGPLYVCRYRPAEDSSNPGRLGSNGRCAVAQQGQAVQHTSYDVLVSAPPPPAGDISLSSSTLDFGSLQTGETASQSLTITNYGPGDLILGTVDVPASGFEVSLDGEGNLGVNQVRTVTVTFAPELAGPHDTTLVVNSNDADTPTAAVAIGAAATDPPVTSLNTCLKFKVGSEERWVEDQSSTSGNPRLVSSAMPCDYTMFAEDTSQGLIHGAQFTFHNNTESWWWRQSSHYQTGELTDWLPSADDWYPAPLKSIFVVEKVDGEAGAIAWDDLVLFKSAETGWYWDIGSNDYLYAAATSSAGAVQIRLGAPEEHPYAACMDFVESWLTDRQAPHPSHMIGHAGRCAHSSASFEEIARSTWGGGHLGCFAQTSTAVAATLPAASDEASCVSTCSGLGNTHAEVRELVDGSGECTCTNTRGSTGPECSPTLPNEENPQGADATDVNVYLTGN